MLPDQDFVASSQSLRAFPGPVGESDEDCVQDGKVNDPAGHGVDTVGGLLAAGDHRQVFKISGGVPVKLVTATIVVRAVLADPAAERVSVVEPVWLMIRLSSE